MTEAAATVVVDQKLFEEVKRQFARVDQARTAYNAAAEEAKGCKKELEGAQKTLESLIRRLTEPAGELPLFANQSEALEAAEADPVVTKLVERLIAAGQDVNAILVAGWNQDERAAVSGWLDAIEAREAVLSRNKAIEDAGGTYLEPVPDAPELPAILAPQPLTMVEVADLLTHLAAEDFDGITAEMIAGWSPAQIAEVKFWLDELARVSQEKGAAVTFEDLPVAPAFLVEAQERADGATAESDVDDADGEEPEPNEIELEDDADEPSGPTCAICGSPDATETTKTLNGLPKGVLACDDCRTAVKRRQVGVVRRDDGTLHITDARRQASEAEPVAHQPEA